MTGINHLLHSFALKKVAIAPLVTFRFLFGAVMFVSILRFWANGWIEMQYIQPGFHFKYFGFEWVQGPGPWGYYAIFSFLVASTLGIALGAFYRVSAIVFFLLFTYVELIDATYYLNHYYFISIVGLVMIFLPANRMHSLDVKWALARPATHVPALSINILKLQLGLVYFMAGLAKLNYDWLFQAMPLAIWLPTQNHLPVIGYLFNFEATPYVFSWAGALYDLSIPFLLLFARTRWLAYGAVIAFHLLTWFLFQIGMFPFIMIGATLIFFSTTFHERTQSFFLGKSRGPVLHPQSVGIPKFYQAIAMAFILFQLVFPFRYLLYPGNPFWHEQGYRFGWRVMLMEKAGYAQFRVYDGSGNSIDVDNKDFLTPVQEKMMATQPDFMLQYAYFLKEHYKNAGVDATGVKADVYVTFNGRSSRPFINPNVDLASLEDGWGHKNWILPLEEGEGI